MMPGPVEVMISNQRGAGRYSEYALSGHFTQAGELLRLVTTGRDHFRLVSAQKNVWHARNSPKWQGRIRPQAF